MFSYNIYANWMSCKGEVLELEENQIVLWNKNKLKLRYKTIDQIDQERSIIGSLISELLLLTSWIAKEA